MSDTRRLVIGTRSSKLALWQSEYIAALLRDLYPDLEVTLQHITTTGDRITDKALPQIGGKGLFTDELEKALRAHEIDIAVHSLKDLPTKLDPAFKLAAVPQRASPYDVLISRDGASLLTLPEGAIVGTSSLRRAAQIKMARPDLNTLSLRGNVPTRVDKLFADNSPYDAIILAHAGLDRLGLDEVITEVLAPTLMLPAPAQGALGIQSRADDKAVLELLAPLNHQETRLAVEAERAFLGTLDAGCRLPVAALAWVEGDYLDVSGRVCSLDGQTVINVRSWGGLDSTKSLGKQLAWQAAQKGADDLLAEVERQIANDQHAPTGD